MKQSVFVAAAFFWLAAAPNAHAEPSAGDQKVLKLMNFEPTNGAIFLEVNIAEHERPGPKLCQSIILKIKSAEGVTNTVYVQHSPTLFGKVSDSATYGGAAVIAAGAHTIDSIECEGSIRLKGPFARLTVQAGQMLNLGNLQIVYQIGPLQLFGHNNKGDWRVTDISPRAAASIAKRFPESFAKTKKQYMTAIREGSK